MNALWLLAGAASAATVDVGDDAALHVEGWAEAGFGVHADAKGSPELGTYLGMARLRTRYARERFSSALQVEAATGEVVLLDAVAGLEVAPDLTWRIGRFKTPVSLEFLEPAPELVFVHRALTADVAPRRRVGTELVYAPRFGEVDATVQVGLFDGASTGFVSDAGQLGVVRAAVALPVGIEVHAASATALMGTPDGAPDQVLDLGVAWRHDGWRALAEEVVAWEDGAVTTAGTVSVAHRFHHEGGVDWEPALGVDVLTGPERSHRRATAGLNAYLTEDVVQTVDVVVDDEGEGVSTGVYAQVQVGF